MNKNLKRAILTTIVLMNANYITGYASVYDNTETIYFLMQPLLLVAE